MAKEILGTARVLSDGLNLHDKPGGRFPRKDALKRGDMVTALDSAFDGGHLWYLIAFRRLGKDEETGWVDTDFLSFTPREQRRSPLDPPRVEPPSADSPWKPPLTAPGYHISWPWIFTGLVLGLALLGALAWLAGTPR